MEGARAVRCRGSAGVGSPGRRLPAVAEHIKELPAAQQVLTDYISQQHGNEPAIDRWLADEFPVARRSAAREPVSHLEPEPKEGA